MPVCKPIDRLGREGDKTHRAVDNFVEYTARHKRVILVMVRDLLHSME